LEGTVYELRSDQIVDGVPIERHSDDEDENFNRFPDDEQHTGDAELLPGAGKGSKSDGSRNTNAEILSTALGFSPTGREWAAATTQGLQIFSLDEAIHFAPTDLDLTITPQSIRKAIREHEYTHALNMSLHLSERDIIKEAVDAVAIVSIPLVVKSIDVNMLKRLLRFLADEIV
jgi:periodic tryptophan protein 2